MTPLKKDPKPVPFPVLPDELIKELSALIREMAREQAFLLSETVRTIHQLRELHAYVMRVRKSVSNNACNAQAKIIPFPAPPNIARLPQRPS
jgi:hypothetical protein